MKPRYAPAREDGLKPWVGRRSEWAGSRVDEQIVYARTANEAANAMRAGVYHERVSARRATPEDMETFPAVRRDP